MAIRTQAITVDAFEAFEKLPENRDRYFELIHGEIVEKVPTQRHGEITLILSSEIYNYLREHPVGRAFIEAAYRMPGDTANARQPDISFVSDRSRPVVDRGRAPYTPDLAIEIKSPDDSIPKMREKAAYYLQNGARLVWLIYPEKRLIEVYTAQDVDILTDGETLSGGDVLPGFSLPVANLFESA